MYSHLILFLLPAFGMTAMSAPNAAAANGTDYLNHDGGALFRRAPNFCGFDFRGDPTMGPEENRVFQKDGQNVYAWHAKGTSHTGLHKEHPNEVAMVITALDEAGFTKAWEGLLEVINGCNWFPLTRDEIFNIWHPLKLAANKGPDMFYCHPDINQDKKTLVRKIRDEGKAVKLSTLAGVHHRAALKDYIKGVEVKALCSAQTTDSWAQKVLDNLHTAGMGNLAPLEEYTKPEDKAAVEDYTKKLDAAYNLFKPMDSDFAEAVERYWGFVAKSVDM